MRRRGALVVACRVYEQLARQKPQYLQAGRELFKRLFKLVFNFETWTTRTAIKVSEVAACGWVPLASLLGDGQCLGVAIAWLGWYAAEVHGTEVLRPLRWSAMHGPSGGVWDGFPFGSWLLSCVRLCMYLFKGQWAYLSLSSMWQMGRMRLRCSTSKMNLIQTSLQTCFCFGSSSLDGGDVGIPAGNSHKSAGKRPFPESMAVHVKVEAWRQALYKRHWCSKRARNLVNQYRCYLLYGLRPAPAMPGQEMGRVGREGSRTRILSRKCFPRVGRGIGSPGRLPDPSWGPFELFWGHVENWL